MRLWDWVMDKLAAPAGGSSPVTTTIERTPSAPTVSLEDGESANPTAANEQDETVWWAPPDATLTEPALIPRPELDAEERALESALIEDFDGHNLTLPPLPRVPERVLSCLANPRSSARHIANELGEDQVTAAAVLRIANSPLYRGLDKITALEPAVVRLGNTALRTLMLHQSMRAVALQGRHGDHERTEILLIRALAGAAVMRALSRFTSLSPEDAFMIGLLHDIGALIVLRTCESQQAFSRHQIDDATFEYLCQETHQEFGELIADAWNLPERLKTLISDHHQHPRSEDPYRTERLQLQLADMICALLGYAPAAPYDLLESRAALDLSLPARSDFIPFLRALPEELDQTMEAFL